MIRHSRFKNTVSKHIFNWILLTWNCLIKHSKKQMKYVHATMPFCKIKKCKKTPFQWNFFLSLQNCNSTTLVLHNSFEFTYWNLLEHHNEHHIVFKHHHFDVWQLHFCFGLLMSKTGGSSFFDLWSTQGCRSCSGLFFQLSLVSAPQHSHKHQEERKDNTYFPQSVSWS